MNDMAFSMTIALVGWLASSYAIKQSRLSGRIQRLAIIPMWFVWLALALGGPVSTGHIAFVDAVTSGAACTAGMVSFLFFSALRSRRTPR